ncbi:hypothetical protein [Tahibacter amnicola]|uniref:Transmembrane protein n=1 Tax=Tahibacter amnicola TaxID=2976241 RepID=A0ABY6B8A5_9GAMM|nr:hypothetical protein [Tahibacter amnicola]UXI65904.1 hypothetical protein N4264_14170 [Tahibacter amnicola]
MDFARPFRSDPQRHDGVRPIQIWGLRLFYLLMLVFVAPTAWSVLLTHQGEWKAPLSAIAWAVWATYPCLAVFGLFQPLRWLPILFFALGYKAIWLGFVAAPLWLAGSLEGSPAQPIAESFLALPLLALFIPWGYAWRTYVMGARPASARAPREA